MAELSDLPDFRAFTADQDVVGGLLAQIRVARPVAGGTTKGTKAKAASKSPSLPAKVDLREYFSPVRDQETIGACTTHAGGSTKGALLIRNSWGPTWGEDGYGWLPYDYVLRGLAADWWSLVNSKWIDTGRFGL